MVEGHLRARAFPTAPSAPPYPERVSAMSNEPRTSVPAAARAALECLRSVAPDTGDDRTQVDVDDVLEALEARLVRLGGATP